MRPDIGSLEQPFPVTRPEVVIRPVADGPPEVDWCELLGWPIVPRLGEGGMWAAYDPPDWGVTTVTWLAADGACQVHGVEGVAIDVLEYLPEQGWGTRIGRMWARLTSDQREWLAVYWPRNEPEIGTLYTFLDDGFDGDWGAWPRRAADDGWLRDEPDGGLCVAPPEGATRPVYTGHGAAEVTIDGTEHRCLRVVGLEDPKAVEGVVTEHFLNAEGRQVYQRHWRSIGDQPTGDDVFRVDGIDYLPWYDCLTSTGWPAARGWLDD